ncbi:unnamed protein product [Rotaria sordida]|uniref:Uncharacterized protein n=1 Tax=Rotaria sordida TaxID=392033 RepID=A0A814K3Z7_9BILA|nr:unnamed protein product [Rotaria sordida]CAF1324895.1 unnamed protein product [Rotaria sordida]
MATFMQKPTIIISPDINDNKENSITNNENNMIIEETHHDKEDIITTNSDPITACEALRQQNDALRQELHDIRQEMDEITDQFRTEDAEEFKQLQAELEVAAKNCRILQFKLRKSEKRNETIEAEKAVLEEKIQQIIRDNNRARDFDEELLIAKEVSVRLHGELEKSEESRLITEKLNMALKQNLDTLKESLDQQLIKDTNDDYPSWQLSVYLYESLFREYILMEELAWLNTKNFNSKNSSNLNNNNRNDLSDLIHTYQQKISQLNNEISNLKHDVNNRDKELSQLRIQYKILNQRSRSADRNSNTSDDENNNNRSKRGVSVDGGEHLREQLNTSHDEIRLLKNKLLRSEDELNNIILEKESLLAKIDEQSKQGVDDTINQNLQIFINKIETLTTFIKENKINEKIVTDLQHSIRSSRWNKQLTDEQVQTQSTIIKTMEQTSEITQQAKEFVILLQNKQDILDKIRYRLTNLTYDTNDTCSLLEELDKIKKNFEDKQENFNHLQKSYDNLQNSSKTYEEQFQIQINKYQLLEKTFEQQKIINNELQQENTRLSSFNIKQSQDLKHLEQLRQSILTFEKKLDQKQTRVNELSMKIIEKEDIIETKVKECQKHRLELRELETKYYTLGKQLEEQISAMTIEIEKLNVEKEMLKFDLESIRLNQRNDRPASVRSTVEDEIARVKSECHQQIVDGEIECYKLRLNQSTSEKDELVKTIKELEKKYKELQIKYDANEQAWARLKTDTSDKQRKFDESIKLKSELQNAVDRLRQKLYDLEIHSQEKQNKYTIDKQQWETERLELVGKINELEEQLSKVTKRQRKDLEASWKKERNDLQKQLQQSQQSLKDLQKQIINREVPSHLTEKINILITENELLLNKIKELENVVDDVQLVKSEMERLRDKNSSDWNYWRKQQSDLYAQLRQQQFIKESILNKFDRLQKQIRSSSDNNHLARDVSVGPISLNSFHNETNFKTNLLSSSHESLMNDIELPHGTIDGRTVNANEIAGTINDSTLLSISNMDHDKQQILQKTYSTQENTAASLEEITVKIERVEDNLFSYRRFMDFIRAKSEKSSSVVRDDSLTNIINQTSISTNHKRLASAPPENLDQRLQRRSRFDANPNNSHEHIPSSFNENHSTDLSSDTIITPTTNYSKNRFFSLSRRFRFRTQSPEKNLASVHFLDEDIDLETKEPTIKKSDKPSKGILKALRHRSPFRFRSKDAIIIEQEPSPPPPPQPSSTPPPSPPPKEGKQKLSVPSTTKHRGRFIELKKTTTTKTSSSNTNSRKNVNITSMNDTSASSLIRRTSGLKDLIHKFEVIPPKPKRITTDNLSSTEISQDEKINSDYSIDDQQQQQQQPRISTKTIDIPDLLQNVEKDSPTMLTKPILRHSNSNKQTASFDSATSMISATESINTTSSTTRKPTSTARPLMLSINKEESS